MKRRSEGAIRPREEQIIAMKESGMSTAEVAQKLGLESDTVNSAYHTGRSRAAAQKKVSEFDATQRQISDWLDGVRERPGTRRIPSIPGGRKRFPEVQKEVDEMLDGVRENPRNS